MRRFADDTFLTIIQHMHHYIFCHRGKSKRKSKKSAAGKDCFSLDINTFFKYILLPSGASPLKIESRVLPQPQDQPCSSAHSHQKSLGCSLTQKISHVRVLTHINRVSGASSPRHKKGEHALAGSHAPTE